MKISIVVAVAENNVIGNKNKLPWYIPADLKHFKEVTMGHHVVFGQTTYKSIGRNLPGRHTIVLSNNKNLKIEGAYVANSPQEAIDHANRQGEKELMICGGAMIYKTFLPLADKIYLTKIKAKIDGDVTFPEIGSDSWKMVFKVSHTKDIKNPYDYEFIVLDRKNKV